MDIETNIVDIIYLDYASTTPVDERVVGTMLPYFTRSFGNAASRTHAYGWESDEAVKIARRQIAELLGAKPEELVFTSGATEAVNLALKGIYELHQDKDPHFISITTEHKAVLDTCSYLESRGAKITYLPVDSNGLVNIQHVQDAINSNTVLITVMYANNETGVLQPIKELARVAHDHNILFMTDATQAVGKIPMNVEMEDIDLLACSAHKLYGPKGIGALMVRKRFPRIKLPAQMHGGGHEKGFRSGTLNTPAIAGFGKACELARAEQGAEAKRLESLRLDLEASLQDISGCFIHGQGTNRLPHITNFYVNGIDAEALILQLRDHLAVSSGSACTSAEMLPSHVLMAMHQDEEIAYSSVRISLGRSTSDADVAAAAEHIKQAIENLRLNF